MKIIGIDPGSTVTGYGVIEKVSSSSLKCITFGVIRLKAGAPLYERLLEITEGLNEVISEYKPDEAAIESVFHAKNVKSAITLGHARGAALVSVASSRIKLYEYSPTEIKNTVTGFGRAEKLQVKKMVKALLSLKATMSSDASDALATAICHASMNKKMRSTQGTSWRTVVRPS